MKLSPTANDQKPMQIVNRKSEIVNAGWLPDMDLNHDKQIQSLLCYRYTIGQIGALNRLNAFVGQSSHQRRTGVAPVSNFRVPLKRKIFSQRQARRLSFN
jgi:hypothetical protein